MSGALHMSGALPFWLHYLVAALHISVFHCHFGELWKLQAVGLYIWFLVCENLELKF
jgi:hypothetical protein